MQAEATIGTLSYPLPDAIRGAMYHVCCIMSWCRDQEQVLQYSSVAQHTHPTLPKPIIQEEASVTGQSKDTNRSHAI